MRLVRATVLCAAVAMCAPFAYAQSNNQAKRDTCENNERRDPLKAIAELRDVVGNVLVSTKDGLSSGADKQRLLYKTRVTTTSRASVTISFDCGCDIKLKENERIDVEDGSTCAALLAAVTAVPVEAAIGTALTTTTATTLTAGGLTGSTALIVGGVGVGGYLLYRSNRNTSPN